MSATEEFIAMLKVHVLLRQWSPGYMMHYVENIKSELLDWIEDGGGVIVHGMEEQSTEESSP